MNTATAALDHVATACEAVPSGQNTPVVPADVAETSSPAKVDEIAAVLHDRSTCPARRDRIWAYIINEARSDTTNEWTVIAAGLAMPGLRRAAARVARIWPHDEPGDTDAEVLAGFVTALAATDVSRPRVCSRLVQAAYSAGRASARRHIRAAQTRQRARESRVPPPVSGHVDLVLARAIHEGIITRNEATIIGATRLDHRSLAHEAATRGTTEAELQLARSTAEAALCDWISGSGDQVIR